MPLVRLLDCKFFTWVSHPEPWFSSELLYETPTCRALSLGFLNGACFDVCLLPAALPSERRACLPLGYDDLASLQRILKKIHRVVQLSMVDDHKDWLL